MLKFEPVLNSRAGQEVISKAEIIRFCEVFDSLELASFDARLKVQNCLKRRGSELADLVSLADALNLDFKAFYYKDFCLEALIAQNLRIPNTELSLIPRKYLLHQNSSTTSLNSLLNQFQNKNVQEYVLRRLQIPRSYLEEKRPLSILAINDAIKILKIYSNENEFQFGALENCKKFIEGDFGKSICQEGNLAKIYESSFYYSSLIEQSWDYQILSATGSGMTVKSVQTRNEGFESSYTNEDTTFCRLEFIKNISRFCGYTDVLVTELNQTAFNAIEFRLEFSAAKQIF